MKLRSILFLVLALGCLAPPAATADLGVERASRSSGGPGDEVTLTLGCGFCSAIGGKAPAAFPVSLVRVDKAPRPYRCRPNVLCSPRVRAVPRRAPFTYLGEARPSGNEKRVIRRYVLGFTIPKLAAGTYTYAIYCDACLEGKGGSLIAAPAAGVWRLRIRR